jgi:maleylpyruvate isomerase
MSRPILYGAVRSSAAYRVRIALNLKGVDYESLQLNLLGGEQASGDYRALNPQGLVPMLEIDGHRLTQSLSIIMYLATRFPEPPLLPQDAADAAHVRAMALAIACDIHPLNNLRVLRYLVHELGVSEEKKTEWYRHWLVSGLDVLEKHLARDPSAGPLCHGHTPTIADCLLVPQVFNAQRHGIDVSVYPNIARINAQCIEIPAFVAAHPSNQPDAE